MMKVTRGIAAKTLAPNQYGLGIRGGVDFIVNAMTVEVERHITSKQNVGEIPSRVLVVLDLVNMFDLISKEKAHQMLLELLPWTVPLFDLLYEGNTIMFFTRPDGLKGRFEQEEGSQQGCPFGALIANLVLLSIYN